MGTVALALNAAWELLARPLYQDAGPVLHCLRAAVTDAGWTLSAGAVAMLAVQRWGRGAFLPWIVVQLAMVAVGIELWALSTNRWSYDSTMPTLAGLGVAPLIQLPMLGFVAAGTARLTLGRSR